MYYHRVCLYNINLGTITYVNCIDALHVMHYKTYTFSIAGNSMYLCVHISIIHVVLHYTTTYTLCILHPVPTLRT